MVKVFGLNQGVQQSYPATDVDRLPITSVRSQLKSSKTANRLWISSSFALSCLAIINPSAIAQIIPDAELPVNSVVTPQKNTNVITGGTTVGGNLFHSFEQFNVPTGGTAYFNNSSEIGNIITRVTGVAGSNIDGSIQANGMANLFLINPNGIIFGENARLEIGGSFLATTADSLLFADGSKFGARDSETPALLTVSVPTGLQFNQPQQNAGQIRVLGPGLRVPTEEELNTPEKIISYEQSILNSSLGFGVQPGRTLALVGGEVAIAGGGMAASEGRIAIAAVRNGEIRTANNESVLDSSLIVEPTSKLSNIQISQNSAIATGGAGGGDIQIIGDRVTISDRSIVVADTLGNQNAGSFSIQAGQLIVRDGSKVTTGTYNAGRGGTLRVRGSESVEVIGADVDGFGSVLGAESQGTGVAGDVRIETGRLILRDGAVVGVAALGSGRAGNLTVNATESVEAIGTSPQGNASVLLAASTGSGSNAGDAGTVTIATGKLIVRDGGQVGVVTQGSGRGGNLTIRASESVELIGTSATGQGGLFAGTGGTGDAGNIAIATEQLIVRDGAAVSVGSFAPPNETSVGKAGNIEIFAGSISLDNKAQLTAESSNGAGGNILLQGQQVQLRRNSNIAAFSGSTGLEGNISIDTDTLVALQGSNIIANNDAKAGVGSNIRLQTQGIFFSPDSQIIAKGSTTIETTADLPKPDVPQVGVLNPEKLIIQGCAADRGNTFYITGKGGLPHSPNEPLNNYRVLVDLVEGEMGFGSRGARRLRGQRGNRSRGAEGQQEQGGTTASGAGGILPGTPAPQHPSTPAPPPLVEATGWAIADDGKIVLTAAIPNGLSRPRLTPSGCTNAKVGNSSNRQP